MRYLLTIVILLSACSQDKNTHTGETYMGDYVSVTLEEDLNSPYVSAVVELNDPLENAELWIDDILIGSFVKNKIYFEPEKFGDIECKVLVKDSTGKVLKTLADTIQLYIETGFIQYNSDGINGDIRQENRGYEVVLTPSNVSLGSNDKIWAYNVRVPNGSKISFDYIASKLTDSTPHFGNNLLQLHFRLDDYADRFDLYPGEPYPQKFIDAETDKWISAPLELTHGIYTVYVCPNEKTDRNRVSVLHSSDFSSGMFTANYESIYKWPND